MFWKLTGHQNAERGAQNAIPERCVLTFRTLCSGNSEFPERGPAGAIHACGFHPRLALLSWLNAEAILVESRGQPGSKPMPTWPKAEAIPSWPLEFLERNAERNDNI